MSEILLLPYSIYLIDSILSCIYTRSFLKEKYGKRAAFFLWGAACFFIQIAVFEIWDGGFPLGEVTRILLNVCILLFLQFFFFEKDITRQLFVVFSFVAGKEIVKNIISVFWVTLSGLYGKILSRLAAEEIIKEFEKSLIWIKVFIVFIVIVCALLYVLLLSVYMRLASRKFVRKDYHLQAQENIFLILPCIAALCILVTMKMMIISVENGMTVMIYDTVPATRFWIPFICALLLSAIIASVILFQKLVQYNEEAKKRAILENQVRQMQKEIEEIQEIYTDMRGLRHDMRSHLANISLLVRNMSGPAEEELENYIGKMEETVKRLDFNYRTGNPITDIIVHQKGQEAEKKQIQFEVDFTCPAKLLIDIYDIAVILNNALENAIEACCRTEGAKQIRLRSYVKGNLFFIEIENDFLNEIAIEEKSGLPVSSKENRKQHGIGISNIQRCAKKYMGDIDIVISDTNGRKKFCLTVMMNGKSGNFTPKTEQFTPRL